MGRIAQEGINVISPNTPLYFWKTGGDFALSCRAMHAYPHPMLALCRRIKPPCRAIHCHRGQGAHVACILPYRIERDPQELFAAIPPSVARDAVDTSTDTTIHLILNGDLDCREINPRLHRGSSCIRVIVQNAVQMFGEINDQGIIYCLP